VISNCINTTMQIKTDYLETFVTLIDYLGNRLYSLSST